MLSGRLATRAGSKKSPLTSHLSSLGCCWPRGSSEGAPPAAPAPAPNGRTTPSRSSKQRRAPNGGSPREPQTQHTALRATSGSSDAVSGACRRGHPQPLTPTLRTSRTSPSQSKLQPSGTFLARRPSFASICSAYISLPSMQRRTARLHLRGLPAPRLFRARD